MLTLLLFRAFRRAVVSSSSYDLASEDSGAAMARAAETIAVASSCGIDGFSRDIVVSLGGLSTPGGPDHVWPREPRRSILSYTSRSECRVGSNHSGRDGCTLDVANVT